MAPNSYVTFTGAYQHTQTNKQFNCASNKREGVVHTLSKRAAVLRAAVLRTAVLCNAVLVIADFVGAAGVLGQHLSGRQLPSGNAIETSTETLTET